LIVDSLAFQAVMTGNLQFSLHFRSNNFDKWERGKLWKRQNRIIINWKK